MTNTCSLPFPAQASELNCSVLPEDKLHFIPQMKPVSLSGGASQNSVVWGTWQVPNENKCITLCLMRFCVVSLFGGEVKKYISIQRNANEKEQDIWYKTVPVPACLLPKPIAKLFWVHLLPCFPSNSPSPERGARVAKTELLLKGISSNMATNKSGATQYVETQNGRGVHVKTKLQNTFWTCHI